MKKNNIIGIAGESGVGKSTIADIVSLFFGNKDTIIISTDDLHKWERTNLAWKNITHLNPNANNLELGDIHLNELSQGKSIYRSIYNHQLGYFDPPIKIDPKKNIIIEGLHAFYTDFSKKTIDLKIFIDTDEELRIHWKIIRDTEDRGYKYNMVLDTINKRKIDSEQIRSAQINDADVIIKIMPQQKIMCLGDKNEKIDLDFLIYPNDKLKNLNLFTFIKNYNTEFNKFIKISEVIGNNIELCQNGGGNISTKIDNSHMIVKSSGYNLKDVHNMNGYSLVKHDETCILLHQIINDCELNNLITNSVVSNKYKKPSMETGFHVLLKKYVMHLHPIYLTLILCLNESEDIIKELFSNINYQYIKYANPGFDLLKSIKLSDNDKEIYFLENHGLIISSNDIELSMNLLNKINNISKHYLRNYIGFEEFELLFFDKQIEKNYLFPDAVIFDNDLSKKEIIATHNYIDIVGSKIGNLRYLTSSNIHKLKIMESEKYRKIL